MVDVFLDPFLLVLPIGEAGPSVVQRYAEMLQDWGTLSREGQFRLMKSRDTDAAIYCDAPILTHSQLDMMLRRWGIHNVSAHDIFGVVDQLLRNAVIVEDLLKLEGFITDEVEVIPEGLFLDRPEPLVANCKTTVMLALFRHYKESSITESRPILVTRDSPHETASVIFSGNVLWNKPGIKAQEQQLNGEMLLHSSPAAFRDCILPSEKGGSIWTLLESDEYCEALVKLTPEIVDCINKAKEYLSRSPMKVHGNTVKALQKDKKGLWRFRIHGDYRLVYRPDAKLNTVELLKFDHRRDIYN